VSRHASLGAVLWLLVAPLAAEAQPGTEDGLPGKRVELLSEAVPNVTRINMRAAKALGITIPPPCCSGRIGLSSDERPLLPRWRAFLAANDIEVAGVEFIVDEAGHAFTYDINTNTNYNPDAEARDGRRGMGAVASYLDGLLVQGRQPRPEALVR
jgi:hypothetical protein